MKSTTEQKKQFVESSWISFRTVRFFKAHVAAAGARSFLLSHEKLSFKVFVCVSACNATYTHTNGK